MMVSMQHNFKESNMVKIYGSELCPDCVECKYNFDINNLEYESIDINKELKNLKAFLKLRDTEDAFKDIIGSGSIGIPALVLPDGTVTLDWEKYFTDKGIEVKHPEASGAACNLDGSGC